VGQHWIVLEHFFGSQGVGDVSKQKARAVR